MLVAGLVSTPPRGSPGQRLSTANRRQRTRRSDQPTDLPLWHTFDLENHGWMAMWLAAICSRSSLVLELDAGMFVR